MLNKRDKQKLENHLYKMLKESLDSFELNNNSFFQESNNDSKSTSEKKEQKSKFLSLSAYKDEDEDTYDKLKTIVPILTSTYDKDVNTYNLTHSQLAYEMYPNLDPDTARSKFSQKVTGKKTFYW